jgi:hypothetical protein
MKIKRHAVFCDNLNNLVYILMITHVVHNHTNITVCAYNSVTDQDVFYIHVLAWLKNVPSPAAVLVF